MDKLEQAMEKALLQPPLGGGGRLAARRRGARSTPLLDSEHVALADLKDSRLRSNKIVGQLMDGQSAWKGHRRAVEAFRMVRTRTIHALEAVSGGAQVFAITSPRQGDGKTLVSINLAMGIARQPNQHVLLIDADLRRPGMAKTLGIRPRIGLSDYLAGNVSLEEAAQRIPDTRLFFVPQVTAIAQSSELLANGVLEALSKKVQRSHPDWTLILDCPPILAVDDTLVALRTAQKAVLVVREAKTTRSEMRRAAQAIGQEKYLGTILNDSRASASQGQQYYYDYGYESR